MRLVLMTNDHMQKVATSQSFVNALKNDFPAETCRARHEDGYTVFEKK